MKILYLRLVNSAGIYAGTSKREIEIDFTKGNNNIVMLFGGNGSGKTSLLSSIHPFTGTCNDERDKFFIEGKEGEKEIHYLVDDTVYMIRHYISAKNKTKSFMAIMDYQDYLSKLESRDELADKYGTELNENGGVTTFKELVETHLGVDEEFFKISRIGSNVTNFIDLSTANRKKYISTFLPNIDEYLQRYKIVNEKYKLMTKEIKYLSDEILKLDDITVLKAEKTRLEKQIESLRILIERLSNFIATSKATVANLDADGTLKKASYENPYTTELAELERKKTKSEKSLAGYTLAAVTEQIDDCEKQLTKIDMQISQLKELLANNKESLGTIAVNIKAKKKQISGMTVNDLDALKKTLQQHTERSEMLKDELDNLDLSLFSVADIPNEVSHTAYLLRELYSTLSTEKSKISIDQKNILDKIFTSNVLSWEEFLSGITDMKKEKADREKTKGEQEKELSVLYANKKYLTILEKRPDKCNNDNCPFISTALKYKNVENEIEELSKVLANNTKLIEDLEIDIDNYEQVKVIAEKIKTIFDKEKDELTIISGFMKNCSFNTFHKIMQYFLSTNSLDMKTQLFEGGETLKYYNSLKAEIAELEKDSNIIAEKIKINENIDGLYQELTHELQKLENSYNDTINTINTENVKLEKYINSRDELCQNQANYLSIRDEFIEREKFLETYNTVRANYAAAEATLLKIAELAEKIAADKEQKDSYSKQIPLLESSLDSVKLKISKFKEYSERKSVLEKNYEKTSWIKDALNPTKGIPVYFIEDYLNRTKFITNNLLDISQHGKFAISFEVTDKDFFIKVYKNNGDVLSDISQASQGETALTSLSLSLALIEQSMKKYNIFLLDELDGALDTNNRRSFIDMVNTQMKILNSEQVFIISHNNEFENVPIDMILLKDNNIDTNNKEFMENKTVLFNI